MLMNPSTARAGTKRQTLIEKRAEAWQKVITLLLDLGYDSPCKVQVLFPTVGRSTIVSSIFRPSKRGPQARIASRMLDSSDIPPEVDTAINEYFLLCPLLKNLQARASGHPGKARCRHPCIEKSSVIEVRQRTDGTIRRRRRCDQCDFKWSTYEVSGYFRTSRILPYLKAAE